MKKIVAFLVAGLTALALFGCGSSENPSSDPTPTPDPAPVEEPAPPAEPTTTEPAETGDVDVSQIASVALGPGATSEENPAQIGQWFEFKAYSTGSHQDETVYVRITKVIRDQTEVWKILDAYNSEGNLRTWAQPEENDIEYGIITYEVYYPPTFPATDLGITSPGGISLSVEKPGGGGFPSNNGGVYVGLGVASNVSLDPYASGITVNPGDLYSGGRAVFAMVIGYDDFLINTSYTSDAGKQEIWIKP